MRRLERPATRSTGAEEIENESLALARYTEARNEHIKLSRLALAERGKLHALSKQTLDAGPDAPDAAEWEAQRITVETLLSKWKTLTQDLNELRHGLDATRQAATIILGGPVTENLNIGEILAIAGLVLTGIHFQLRRIETALNRRFDDAQRANDAAHDGITENIKRVEQQQDKGFDRLYTLLAAITPRAAAEPPSQKTDR